MCKLFTHSAAADTAACAKIYDRAFYMRAAENIPTALHVVAIPPVSLLSLCKMLGEDVFPEGDFYRDH